MTWTYDGTPGTATAAGRRDAVRMLVGDTDTTDQQSTDEEIAFALDQASNGVYGASAIVARSLAGQYARRVDTTFGSVSSANSQRSKSYLDLATRYEREALTKDGSGLGAPSAGGISISAMDSVEDDSDRVEPAFKRDMFKDSALIDPEPYEE
jgi:hypothetical protein